MTNIFRLEASKDGDTRHGRLYISISCTPDKDIRVFHMYLQILSHPCYLTQDRIKSREFNALVVLEVTYLRRQVTLVFTTVTSKNGVTLSKLDVNVKNRTAVADSVNLFKLE